MQEVQVPFLGWEYPLEESLATHSCILAWRIPWTEKPGGLQSIESQRVGRDRSAHIHTPTTCSTSKSHIVGMLPTLGADTLVGGLAHEACFPFASGCSQAVYMELSPSR